MAAECRMRARAWVVLPTYNERENLASIVPAIVRELAAAVEDPHLLIVDDASPDGTGSVADSLAAELGAVEVLHRAGKEGLGRAYLAGFAHALRCGADLVLEMDADFSHDPRDVPRLVAAARDADLVLGSRYAPGGGVRDWGPVRRLLSRGGCLYARRVLGLPVRDLTGGFKCFRRELLESLVAEGARADGYCFQVELTARAVEGGFRVREIPIVFRERRAGSSKMTVRIALEAVWQVPALRLRQRRRSATGSARISPLRGMPDRGGSSDRRAPERERTGVTAGRRAPARPATRGARRWRRPPPRT